ncbi:MAG TPA: LysE family translocator [Gaiellaceae bacterium]|nr:LysE family translocator [Gaiellaceae bacterium]
MVEPAAYAVFLGAALALLVVPGPAVLYIVARSVHQGRRAGLASVLGIHVGTLVHVLAATVGLSALLASSATAFTVVKLLGAAYLVYLGIRTLAGRGDRGVEASPSGPTRGRRRDFAEGIVVNVLNPKTALFFVAFLPQFVDPDAGAATLQILVLGLTFMLLGLVTDSLWALAAGTAGDWLRGHRGFLRAQRWVSGSIYLGLGALTALAGPHRSSR